MKQYKIAVAGTGYVGMSIATLLAQHHQVTAVDVIPEKVEKLNKRISPIQDEYIEKYEYTYKCFDRGNELFELERNGKLPYPAVKEKVICMTIYQCPNCGNYLEEHSNCCPQCRILLDWENMQDDVVSSDGRHQ